ncbi:MAG: amphi-Trp domain-containing protein [Candidatus Eisenbacteria bacterium]|nr:amphi-Trp domain-containing protein [Candidatus Eisenbacteria bacterium]
MKSTKVSVKQELSIEKAAEYLSQLSDSLKERKIVVAQGEEFVTLNPPDTVHVKVSAKTKEHKQEFSMELVWAPGDSEEQPVLRIGSEEPHAQETPAAAPEDPLESEL